MDQKKVHGRDISAPLRTITIDGIPYKLVFSNETFRIAEDVYEREYKKDVGFAKILNAVMRQKYSAIMAFFYAAMVAGGCDLSWSEFDAKFRLTDVDDLQELIMQGLGEALPEVDPDQDPQTAPAKK